MPLTHSAATHGAAYQVCYERLNPDNCTSHERMVEIEVLAQRIREWAASQGESVKNSYCGIVEPAGSPPQLLTAVDAVVKRARDRLENHIRWMQLRLARESLMAPPEDLR